MAGRWAAAVQRHCVPPPAQSEAAAEENDSFFGRFFDVFSSDNSDNGDGLLSGLALLFLALVVLIVCVAVRRGGAGQREADARRFQDTEREEEEGAQAAAE